MSTKLDYVTARERVAELEGRIAAERQRDDELASRTDDLLRRIGGLRADGADASEEEHELAQLERERRAGSALVEELERRLSDAKSSQRVAIAEELRRQADEAEEELAGVVDEVQRHMAAIRELTGAQVFLGPDQLLSNRWQLPERLRLAADAVLQGRYPGRDPTSGVSLDSDLW